MTIDRDKRENDPVLSPGGREKERECVLEPVIAGRNLSKERCLRSQICFAATESGIGPQSQTPPRSNPLSPLPESISTPSNSFRQADAWSADNRRKTRAHFVEGKVQRKTRSDLHDLEEQRLVAKRDRDIQYLGEVDHRIHGHLGGESR